MAEFITAGLGLPKNVVKAHGAYREGNAVLRKKHRRALVLEFFANLLYCLLPMRRQSARQRHA